MFFVIVVAIAIIITIICGGRLENLMQCKFKHAWLVILATSIKVISFSNLHSFFGISNIHIPYMRIISMFMVVLFIGLNISLRGLWLVGVGLICNMLPIVFNGGYMPVKAEYIPLIASSRDLEKLSSGLPAYNFIPTSHETSFSFLADIFLMPDWVPMSKVFSVGDVLITIGGIIFVTHYLRSTSGNST